MDLLERMLGHDQWATARLLAHSRDLTDAQLDQPFEIGNGSLRVTLAHLVFVIDFWTMRMAGQPAPPDRAGHPAGRASQPSMAELLERHARYHAAFAVFARQALDEQRLDDTFVDHYGIRQSLGSTIIQVMHHNAQHRGEARHMLERLGVPDLWDLDPQEWEHVTQRS